MKKLLIILSLFLISCAHGYKTTYINQPCPNCINQNRTIFRPIYGPYGNFNPYYRNNALYGKKFNNIGFFKRNNGTLTGYSVPINKNDIYKQMGISPYSPKAKQKYNSINCSQELFSAPSGDEIYYKNGEYYKDLNGVSGKTGVTIIYD